MGPILNPGESNARAWGLPGVLDFFAAHRRRYKDVYPSESFFMTERLRPGISVLDVGCAQGGFAEIISERISDFTYTGLDINAEMIARAQTRYPAHKFHTVVEADYEVLAGERFDLVLALGILHLHESWRRTLAGAWASTRGSLIFDLRQIEGPTVEDLERSYMRMDFGGDDKVTQRVPYILLNAAEAQGAVSSLCPGARSIAQYGYRHSVTALAVCPVSDVMTITWCVER